MEILELGQSPRIIVPVETNRIQFQGRREHVHTTAGCAKPAFTVLQPQTESLLEEYILDIHAGTLPPLHINCTPRQLPAMILGRLMTDGIITCIEDIARIEVHPDKGTAEVTFAEKRVPGAHNLKENSGSKGPAWDASWIRTLYARFCEDTDLHRITRCTHSCLLMREGEIIAETEDIGRHNAIDKAVGSALLQRVPLSECVLFTTGRLSEDMVMKAVRAGIQVLVSKEAPTTAGVRAAREAGITIIGKVRDHSMVLYTGSGRAS